MTASERLSNPVQAYSGSQRRRVVANTAVDSSTLKRTPRATRTSNQTAGIEVNGVEDNGTPYIPKESEKVEAVVRAKVPLAPPKGATPKTKQRKEVKQETDDTQEQEPQVKEISTKAKRKPSIEEDQQPVDTQVDRGTLKTAKRKRIIKVEEAEIEVGKPSPKKTKRKKAAEVDIDEIAEEESKTAVQEEDEEVQGGEEGQKKIKRKRKTKEEKEIEAMPLAARTGGLRMFIGAHVSGAKGPSFSMYVAPVELRLYRSAKCGYKLRAYWVNSL